MTDTRDRIIDASADLLRRQGYAGTGVKQIVTAAKAPFGSVYHHFPAARRSWERQRSDGPGRSMSCSSPRCSIPRRTS